MSVAPDLAATSRRPLGWRRALLYSMRIRRMEFLPTTLTIIAVPALLFADSAAQLGTWPFIAVAVMVRLIIHFGDMVNCRADRDLDAIYKTRLSEAIYGLGVRNVGWQIRVDAVLIVALATYVAVTTRHWDIIPLIFVELYFAAQYSVAPLHLKSGGAWQIPTLFVIIYGLPMWFVVRALPGEVDWQIVLAMLGFGIAQVGVILVNTAEDLPEDQEHSIRTSVVALGLTRAMAVATAMTGLGGAAVFVALFAIGDPSWGAWALLAASAWVLAHVAGTWLGVRGKGAEAALELLRPRAKLVPVQLAVTGLGTVLAAALVLANR